MRFMRILIQGGGTASYNMALDEAIAEAVRQKLSPPTLRLYQWDSPSVSIGYFQKISDINIDYCGKNGYPVVRRITGGRALLHHEELTYSVSALTDTFPFRSSLRDNYGLVSKSLITGLDMLGIKALMSFSRKRPDGHRNPACFKAVSYGEVTVEGKKIIGSAQKRFQDSFLQQGSVMLSFRAVELSGVMRCGDSEDFTGIGAVNDYGNISFDDLKTVLKLSFEKTLEIKLVADRPSSFEVRLAKELDRSKYSDPVWNFSR